MASWVLGFGGYSKEPERPIPCLGLWHDTRAALPKLECGDSRNLAQGGAQGAATRTRGGARSPTVRAGDYHHCPAGDNVLGANPLTLFVVVLGAVPPGCLPHYVKNGTQEFSGVYCVVGRLHLGEN